MINNRSLSSIAAKAKSRSGFTLVELLVVIGIIAILAGVALGPITNGIKQAKHNAALQQVRQIGQLCFAFSTDNGNYPSGLPGTATGVGIADQLIDANYVTDPSVFVVSSQSGVSTGAVSANSSANLLSTNVSYSFTITTASSGVSSNASDLIPLVYFNNGPGTAVTTSFAASSSGVTVTYGSNAPFGKDGAAIFYKGNNAVYSKAGTTGLPGQVASFVSSNCTDTGTYSVAP